MRETFSKFVGQEVDKRLSLLRMLAAVTLQPYATADRLAQEEALGLWPALRFFFKAVGIVLAVEAAFSLVFDTAFSDLVHHAFPVFIALTGGVAIFLLLILLGTRGVGFSATVESSLYVGGAALTVMVVLIFALLSADFAQNWESVRTSACAHRTIMCLLSGNLQYDYEAIGAGGTNETQGWSYGPILAVILSVLIYYTYVLSTFLKRRMGVARWRTFTAALVSVFALTPVYLVSLNAIYRALYGSE